MRVLQQVLTPGMQDGEEADLGAKCFGSAAISSSVAEQDETAGHKAALVRRAPARFNSCGRAEDDMKVRRRDFLLARGQPTLARLCLTLRAMPVTAGVIRDGLIAASRTGVEMTAQSCRAAVLDGTKNFQLLKAEARPVSVEKAVALCANDVSHLQGGLAHFCLLRVVEPIRSFRDLRCSSGFTVFSQVAARQVEIERGGVQISVAEQHLDGAQVGACFEHVRSETVSQGILVLLMICIPLKSAIAITRAME